MIYLKNQTPEQKEAFLKTVFKPYIDDDKYDYDTVRVLLTDDDIDVVQQYAIWNKERSHALLELIASLGE